MQHKDALDQLARETARARSRLAMERAARLALPAALAGGVWSLAALAGLHERLPLLLQSLTALAALGGLAWLALRARRTWRAPSEAEARARLAADSALERDAFDALGDRPSHYDVLSIALWRREHGAALARAEGARAGPLRLGLDAADPWKLRYLLAALLTAALVVAGAAAPERLARAFLPDPGPLVGDGALAVEAWLTPADYTRAAPISLSDRIGDRIEAPPAVEANVRLTGPAGAPMLVYEGQGGRRAVRFNRGADGAWEARLALPGRGRLKIVRFHTRAAWTITPAPDAAPSAMFASPIAQLADENVALAWRARDDFGIVGLALRVAPVDPPRGLANAAPIDTPIETPAGDPQQAEAESELDLSAHPYAGMQVEARVVAFDATGQEGMSEPMQFAMPEKVFLQPLARAAIESRRHLLTDRRPYRQAPPAQTRSLPAGDILIGAARIEWRNYDAEPPLRRAPQGVRHAARLIDALTMAPEDGYFRDLAVFFGLRVARAQLGVAEDIEATELAADTLWRTALRAEYGGAADARRALEEAQRALAEALQQGAPRERLRQLVEALRRATETYLQALVQEALRNGETAENLDDTQNQTELSENDIDAMMREIERLTEQGRTQEAQAMLDMLAGILANMEARIEQAQQGQGEGGEDQQSQQEQQLDALAEAMGEQRALRDETQQQQQQQQSAGGSGGENQGGAGGEELARQQAGIRQGVAQAREQGEGEGAAATAQLDAAERAMRQAEAALMRGDLNAAEAAQTAALESLREGADQLAAEQREGGEAGEEGGPSSARDPLGRPARSSGGVGAGDETRVPGSFDPVRAREILDEIRRRAEDPNRPQEERDYLRRLMDRFGDS